MLALYKEIKKLLLILIQIYSLFISKYQPLIINIEADNDYFLEVVEELLARKNPTPEENTILDLLVKLIEDFEDKHYQLNISTSRSIMLYESTR